ncbi:MAG: error-prone DNA polymerase [Reyranellaceae bacterium]
MPRPEEPAYAELQVTSNYSFLRGGSHPAELVERAIALGQRAIAVTDRNTLGGVVRAHVAAREARKAGQDIKLLIGCRLVLQDGFSLLAYPLDIEGYGNLCRLLTRGNLRAPKGECHLFLSDVFAHAGNLLAVVVPPDDPDDAFARRLADCADVFRGRCYLAGHHLYRGDDARRLEHLAQLGRRCSAPLVATNDVHYHDPGRRILQDVLSCIRERCTIDEAGWRLHANAERHLKAPAEMARLFRRHPDAVARTLEIARRCNFAMTELDYQYPVEAGVDGRTPQEELERLAWEGAARKFPNGMKEEWQKQLRNEFDLIRERNYAAFFLTVHQIVQFARQEKILCQGRGSAANSLVCYCLGITAVGPDRIDLLFERFLSTARNEPPDIDVDFEHERREEVIQHIYEKYGRQHTALTATVIAYRSRSAIRDVGKVLGLSPDTVGALADTVWGSSGEAIPDQHVRDAGLDPADPRLSLALRLAGILTGFPRHLSQHVGGFVICRHRLDDLVPIANAAMEDRTVIEWDKEDIEALGILKVDVLALGMLSCLRRAFDLIGRHYGRTLGLDIPEGDVPTYEMLSRADSLGVFQVESRAQMSMLPRLKPEKYYDLVVEVAIVRPGPIQGDMVHPYLRRRDHLERIEYPKPELRKVLEKTKGVPLFQEQAMNIAIVAAGFSPSEADGLRRAMATFKHTGTIHKFERKFIDGMTDNGYEKDFAERCFEQIKGFGNYGFPESHAASFALLVYVSSWIKCHYPDVFAAALLNAQPMGFYAPAQIVRDAREHGVEVLPPDVNASDWDCTLEPAPTPRPFVAPLSPGGRTTPLCALRLGWRQVAGCTEDNVKGIVAHRGQGYRGMEELWRRSGASRQVLEKLARADAFRSLGLDRRQALWAVRGLRDERLGLFETPALVAQNRRLQDEPAVELPAMAIGEQVIDDYASLRLSLRTHPLTLLRPALQGTGIRTSDRLEIDPAGRRIAVAGLVLVRQRPGSANGTVFVTLEDEFGIANAILWPAVFESHRRIVMGSRMMRVEGKLQREGLVTHIVAEKLVDLSWMLDTLADDRLAAHARDIVIPDYGRGDEVTHPNPGDRRGERARANVHPRNVRIRIKSHDFH